MNFKLLELGLLAFFGVTAVLVELLRKDVNPLNSPISTYLTGPYSYLEDLGFVALFGALEFLPHYLKLELLPTVLLSASGVGVLFAMLTRKFFPKLFPSLSSSKITQIHVASAAVGFLGAFLGLLASGLTVFEKVVILGTALVCAVFSFYPPLVKNSGTEIAEKLGALGIVSTIALRILT